MPLAALEQELAAVPRAHPGAPVELGEVYTLRGSWHRAIGGRPTKAPRLSEVLRKSPDPARAKDLWAWQTRLANPEAPVDPRSTF
jgi:hypothetical protein